MTLQKKIDTSRHICRPFLPLFDKNIKERYKVFYGGRGGMKSHQIASALIKRGSEEPLFILCTREIQNTIEDSVLELLAQKIELLGLEHFFEVQKKTIIGVNGTVFKFAGLRFNIKEIKSKAKIDICWIEEAQNVSEESWDILTPTVREDNSEIWVSFNPDEEDDATYNKFVINHHPDSIVVRVNYWDNPYFPEVLRKEMEWDKKVNYDKYLHKWEGEPKKRSKVNIYRFNNTINCVSQPLIYTKGIPTYASWDFGIGDTTAIIFWQVNKIAPTEENPLGVVIHIFDEHETNDQGYQYYRKIVDEKKYNIISHPCDPSGSSRVYSANSWVSKLALNPNTNIVDWHFVYRTDLSPEEMVDHANDYLPCVRLCPQQVPKTYNMFKKWKWKTNKDDIIILPKKTSHDEFSHLGTSFYYGMCNIFPNVRKVKQFKATLR